MRQERIPEQDFTAAQLPSNRWQLYWDIVRHQSGTLFAVSLLLFLFALPLWSDYLVFSLLISSSASEATSSQLFALCFYGSLIAVPCLWIFYVGLSGAYRVLSRLSFLEGSLTNAHFFYGIKENGKRALLVGVIVSLSSFLAFIGSLYLLFFYQANPWLVGFGIAILIFQWLVVISLGNYQLAQDDLYDTALGASLKNALIFALMKIPTNTLCVLLFPGLGLLFFAFNSISSYAGIAFFALFSAFLLLGWLIVTHKVFDVYINKTAYPDLVNRGLAEKEDGLCPK